MKPLRNQIFCYGCKKHKMLFETQAKADNFIRYNSEGILEENGKAPIRSYYCEICGGYHVTSNPSEEIGEHLNQRDHQRLKNLSDFKKEIEEIKTISRSLSQRLVYIRQLLFFGETQETEDLLEICKLDIEELSSHHLRGGDKLIILRGRVDKMFELLTVVKGALSLSEEEKMEIISSDSMDKDQQTLRVILSNIQVIQKIDLLLAENDSLLADKKTDGVTKRLNQCRELLLTIQRFGKKEMIQKYNTLFQAQESLLNKVKAGLLILPKRKNKDTAANAKPSSPTVYFDKQGYKRTILSLIERIEGIRKSIVDEDYDTGETLLEIGYYMLDDLQVTDANTKLIKRQLDQLAICINEARNQT